MTMWFFLVQLFSIYKKNYAYCLLVFTAIAQCFVIAFLSVISLFNYDAPSLTHLSLDSFTDSSLQHFSTAVRLDGERQFTAIFRSFKRRLIGFKTGLWLSRSRTFTDVSWSHCFIVLAMCALGCCPYWKVKLRLRLKTWALWSRLSTRMSLFITVLHSPFSQSWLIF